MRYQIGDRRTQARCKQAAETKAITTRATTKVILIDSY